MTGRTDLAPAGLVAVRAAQPLVHCLTNDVTATRVADALAAIGALPVMASSPEEVGEMTRSADALLLNCGTPSPRRWDAMGAAARVAAERGIPVVLDPVGVGASAWRAARAREILALVRPIVRGNAPEVAALASLAAAGTLRGVTAVDVPGDRVEALTRDAARALATTVLVSGPVDAVAEGERMRSAPSAACPYPAVGLGDVLGAVIAAAACVERDRLEAAWAARTAVVDATVRATQTASGPGSFWPAFIDALGAH